MDKINAKDFHERSSYFLPNPYPYETSYYALSYEAVIRAAACAGPERAKDPAGEAV